MRRPSSFYRFSSQRRPSPASDPILPILAFMATLIVGLIVMLIVLPHPVVLPAFSLWSLAAAAGVALIACIRPGTGASRAVTAWDVVGAFTLIGCAAAILGEIEYMVEYLWSPSSRSKAHD